MRRNRLSDFRNVRASGLIAMKLDEGDRLIGVATCREGDDVLLATRLGRCIRFQITDDTLRVFAGRDSAGVRGIRLARGRRGDQPVGAAPCRCRRTDERAAYPASVAARRAAATARTEDGGRRAEAEEATMPRRRSTLTPERVAELEAAEEILLTVTDGGFGKRTSAYDYRVTGRGGQGIANITLAPRNGTAVVGTLPVRPGDDVMLVTDAGRLIRVPADQVRLTGRAGDGRHPVPRSTQGERVTSVFPVLDDVRGGPDCRRAATSRPAPAAETPTGRRRPAEPRR